MLKRYVVLCIFLSFLPLLGSVQAGTNEQGVTRNLEFIEVAVAELADSILAELPVAACSSWVVRCQARNFGDDLAYFFRNVFLIEAKRKLPEVKWYLEMPVPVDSIGREPACRLEMVLTGWRLQALRAPKQEKQARYVQQLSVEMELILTDARGAVRRADRIDFLRQRNIPNRAALERAQEKQPAFAAVEKMPAAGKKDWLNGVLIALATGLTIFLLFQIRSQ